MVTSPLSHPDAALLPRHAKTGEVLKKLRNVRIEDGFLCYDERVAPGPDGVVRMVLVYGCWCEYGCPYHREQLS